MNHTRVYKRLIDRAENRVKDGSVYYENHHIKPKCMGGKKTVPLTAREHFLAHWLLVKIYDDYRMVYAWNCFCMNTDKGVRPTSHLYEYARLRYVKMMKEKIQNGDFIPHSPKGSIWMKKNDKCIRVQEGDVDKYLTEGWCRGRIIKKRVSPTEETRQKMRESNTGQIVSEDTRKKHSRNGKGRIWIYNPETEVCKMVKNVDYHLTNGWLKGRIINK